MGATVHYFISLYSFLMGVLWFNAFILLGLLMRKLKFPVRFSVAPLLLLLVLSILRMAVFIEFPHSIVILSATVYPALISSSRFEILPFQLFGLPVNSFNVFLCIWVIVAVPMIVRYIVRACRARPLIYGISKWTRDEYAEALLASDIGAETHVRVFRSDRISTAFATAFRPYIAIPNVSLSDAQLRIVLLHEWKHIRDKHILAGHFVNFICFVFWWNPFVYIFKRNFSFARELDADFFAVTNREDFLNYVDSIEKLNLHGIDKTGPPEANGASMFLNDADEVIERIKIMYARSESCRKMKAGTAGFSAAIVALFVVSYMFLIQPAFWDVPDVPVSAVTFTEDYFYEDGGIFIAEEVFIVDNGDGTYSLYIDGQFAGYADKESAGFKFFPMRVREEDGTIR